MCQAVDHREALNIQIKETYGKLVYTYTAHLKQAERLSTWNKRFKCAQIILSAASAGGFIGTVISNQAIATWIGGICATILLGINLYFKDFNLVQEISQHHKAADRLWPVRERYISLLTDFSVLNEDMIMQKRDELQRETCVIYEQSPKTDAKSYAAAQEALKNNEEQFFRLDEIDRMLPSHLRVNDAADK